MMRIKWVVAGMALTWLGIVPGSVLAAPNVAAIPGPVGQATVAPDGAHIAYARHTAQGWRIYVSRLDGGNARMVSHGPRNDVEPNWRGDGALLAFSSNRGGNYDLFAMRPDGSGVRQLTHTPQDERCPQWSPRPFGMFQPNDISTRTVAGRSLKGVAPSELKLLEMLAKQSGDWHAYRDERFNVKPLARYYKLLCVEGAGASRQIATMREDGTLRQTLTTGMAGAHLNPCWERTGETIAFLRQSGDAVAVYSAAYPATVDLAEDEHHPRFGVNLKDWRKSIRRLSVASRGAQLGWTPNGQYLAAASGYVLRLLPRPGSGLPPLLANLPGAAAPYGFTWLADARTAVVSVGTGGAAALRAVTVAAPLLDVMNLQEFNSYLKPGDWPYLARNAFVAGGKPRRQMFQIYEGTDYDNLPVFVTTDSLLHLNHLIFDYLLRTVESDRLMPTVVAMTDHYLQASLAQMREGDEGATRAAAAGNAAYFAVAARLALGAVTTGIAPESPAPDPNDPLAADRAALERGRRQAQAAALVRATAPLRAALVNLPPEVRQLADAEMALIKAHEALAASPIFGGDLTGVGQPTAPLLDTRIDYSEFVPRGHYTHSETLRRYFLVTRWLAAGPYRRTADGTLRAALLLAASDDASLAQNRQVLDVARTFVGDADDDTLGTYMDLARASFGGPPTLAQLADAAKVDAFTAKVAALLPPRLAPSRGSALRFLPQPYTPDADIMQGLVYDRNPPDVGTEQVPRYFALGLDVMGVLGSRRARQILDNTQFQGSFFDFDLKETAYAGYDAQFAALRSRFASLSELEWERNLYTRTLHALLPLLQAAPDPRYRFTQSQAWTDKNLNTALAAWTELKHDTMPKQPVALETGEGGLTEEAPIWEQPAGFIEPSAAVLQRLRALVAAEGQVLTQAGYLTPELRQRLDTFSALLDMMTRLEAKQRAGGRLTSNEIEQLRFYGAYQEHLTFVTAEGGAGSMEGNDMAIVADVASAYSTKLKAQLVLEEGVGRALPLYVAVERNGHRELARGAVFMYYEFTHPAEDRLTDAKWRALLDTPQAPALPEWAHSFVSRTSGDDGD